MRQEMRKTPLMLVKEYEFGPMEEVLPRLKKQYGPLRAAIILGVAEMTFNRWYMLYEQWLAEQQPVATPAT